MVDTTQRKKYLLHFNNYTITNMELVRLWLKGFALILEKKNTTKAKKK